MKNGSNIKHNTELVIISVIVLTVVTLNVSYSAFFQVKSLSSVKEIETSDLNVSVTIDTSNSIFNTETEILPMSFEEVQASESNYSTITIVNSGSTDVDYLISLTYDYDAMREYVVDGKKIFQGLTDAELRNYLVSFDNLNVAIVNESTTGEFINFSNDINVTINDPIITDFETSATDQYLYPLLNGSLAASVNNNHPTQVYDMYVWLNENAPVDEIGKYAFLKVIVESQTSKEVIPND